jgi:primase-polymerase (primpol)-like protein
MGEKETPAAGISGGEGLTTNTNSANDSTGPQEPAQAAFRPENIPPELRQLPQWVVHTQKVPYDPRSGELASTTDPSTWGTFEDAVNALRHGGFDGLGYVFAADADIVGIDIDGCRDPVTGEVAEWARQEIAKLNSFTEISLSGRGLHVFVRGKKPGPRCRSRETMGPIDQGGA